MYSMVGTKLVSNEHSSELARMITQQYVGDMPLSKIEGSAPPPPPPLTQAKMIYPDSVPGERETAWHCKNWLGLC